MIYPGDSAIQLLNNWSQMSKNICEILKNCFVSLTAQKDQNIFVLVILKNKRLYLLDISKQYTHVFLNRHFRQADSGADLHLICDWLGKQ